MTASITLAWLGTYLIHSTLLLGAVWVATRWLGRRRAPLSLASEERLWKTALVGGLLTATLQITLAYAPGVELPSFAPFARAAVQSAPAGIATMATPSVEQIPVPAGDPAVEPPGLANTPRPHPGLSSLAALVPGWQRLALAAWILGAAAGLGLLALSWIGLQRTLRGRRSVDEGPTRGALDRLLAARPDSRRVRLSASDRLPVPIALGLFDREICVPERALETFDPRQQEGILAHELAHLERRDPAWTLALRTVEAALFLQPLNRLARKRLLEIAEDRSDSWAVEQTGDRIGLARSLTDVATWLSGLEPAPLASPVPGMAGDRRALGRRVRRILAGTSADEGRPPGRWSLPLTAAALLAIGCLAPGIAPAVPAEAAVSEAQTSEPAVAQAVEHEAQAEWTEQADRAEMAEHDEMAEQDETAGHQLRHYREFHGVWQSEDELDDEQREALEGLEREIERITERAEELARQATPDPEQLERLEELEMRLEELTERSVASRSEALEALQMALSQELAGVGEEHELSDQERERLAAEMERLSEEARRIVEQERPNEEELARLHDLARELAEQARPTQEEIERMSRDFERMNREVLQMNRELQRSNREDVRRIEEQMTRHRDEVERRVREEVERELEASRADLEAEREEMRAERQRMAARQEAHRHEIEERHRDLEERRRELEEREHQLRELREELEHQESGEEHEPPV